MDKNGQKPSKMCPQERQSESSDTDHFFQSNVDASRQKELPGNLHELLTIDEFCSHVTSGNSGESGYEIQTRDERTNRVAPITKRFHSRSHFNQKKAQVTSGANLMASNSIISSKDCNKRRKVRAFDKEAIAEMNRQYDHNICLDRFINDMEQQQQQQERQAQQHSDRNDTDMNETFKSEDSGGVADRTSSNQNTSKMTNMHHIETCSNCSKGSGSSCPWCSSGSSSAAPNSNETESNGSRKSESLKSVTPENATSGKPPEEVNNKAKATVNSREDTEKLEKMFGELNNLNQDNMQHDASSNEVKSILEGAREEENLLDDKNKGKKYKGGKLGRKRKREYIYNPKPVKEKRSKETVPDQFKDETYWEKRCRNNEAARKSRELRRKKELETRDKYHSLKKENEALRVAIALLVKRNETIDFILAEFSNSEKKKSFFQELPAVSA